jgi:hypothetical protein
MRSRRKTNEVFARGVALGVGLCGVALLAVEAVRRIRTRSPAIDPLPLHVDGVRPLRQMELAAQPTPEGNLSRRLESERPDVPPMSQRW